jgi:hypothetical protein
MKTFYIDFEGYCEITANTKEEAEEIFWSLVGNDKPLPSNLYEVEGIEEKEEP